MVHKCTIKVSHAKIRKLVLYEILLILDEHVYPLDNHIVIKKTTQDVFYGCDWLKFVVL